MFCKTVWNGLHILPDGFIRLCSIGQNSNRDLDMQRARDKNGTVMHILTHSIQEIMNSDKHCEVRVLNAANPSAWSPHCDCCENREIITNHDRTHKNKSRRIYLMDIDDNDVVSEKNFTKNKIDIDGNINWMPSSLDIRFGNLCNQKCVMCSPDFSNLWYDEHFDYFKTTSFGQGTLINVTKDKNTNKWIEPIELQWFEDPRWWSKFEEIMPHLKHIYITGGEPMVTPAHDTMLDMLIDSGYAKNVWIEYDTNASAINDKIVQRWTHFKKVDIRASLDAIGDQYELIRFGGKWEKFQNNIKRLRQIQIDSGGQVQLLAASTCFQIPTMYSIIETEEWCNSVGVGFHLRFLEGPARLSVASLSDKSKQELIDYYTLNKNKSTKSEMIITHLQNHIGSEYYKPGKVIEFLHFMNYLDGTRKTDWKAVFPAVVELISKNEKVIQSLIKPTN
jgi:organic radical activating enzyme